MRILVVDDDAMLCESIRRWLASHGYESECAHTVLEAADAVTHSKFQLAIIDWSLGGVEDGIALGRALRRQGMATFMLSGFSKESIRGKWQDPLEGFVEFFDKPPDMADMLTKIQRVEHSLEKTQP